MSDTKEKIQEMIKEEKLAQRREELEESRKKKEKPDKNKKPGKEANPSLDDNKKKLYRSLFFIFLFFVISLGMFYGAGVVKKDVESRHNLNIKANAEKTLQAIMTQSVMTLSHKVNNLNYVLRDAEYIKNFNKESWQSVLKTELEALFGDQAIVEIISAEFSDDDILENPELGYATLSLLNDLKSTPNSRSASHLKIEVHRAKSKNARLMMVRKVTYLDVESNKDVTIGYIIGSIPAIFVKELLKEYKPGSGYIEIVQKFAKNKVVIAKRGDSTLKPFPIMVNQKLNNTQWIFNFWPAEQKEKVPAAAFWQALLYLILGSLAIVSALVMLVLVIKKYKSTLYSVLPERKMPQKAESATAAESKTKATVVQDHATSSAVFGTGDAIAIEDEAASENEYLRLVLDKIFRAYDIRGEVGDYINADMFRYIGHAIAKEMEALEQSTIALGYDGRTSSPELFAALSEALLESGVNIIDLGMVGSPVLYFAAITRADGNGIIVTASHNPAHYNGMKIMLGGHSYNQEKLAGIKQRVLNHERITGQGQKTELNVMEDYFNQILNNVILARPMNIVIDAGNGVTGHYAPAFFEKLGCKVTALNTEVDGNFPKHDPDPSRPENLSELMQAVAEVKADVGIAFDGDGDRIGLISSGGEIIWPDRIIMLLAKDILSRNKDATVIYDIKSSAKLEGFIKEHGGVPLMWKSGHSFMKSKLLETGALLAGEMSGHIFINERWFGFDDALFVAARLLEILSIDLRKSRQVFAELPDSLNTPEILIPTNNGKAIMEQVLKDEVHFAEAKMITIDGLRVEYPDGWGLVRSSNTSDNLTMRFEADNEEALQRIANAFKAALLAVDNNISMPF
jgi:phosphomannomutase/phosphoglucomutase